MSDNYFLQKQGCIEILSLFLAIYSILSHLENIQIKCLKFLEF